MAVSLVLLFHFTGPFEPQGVIETAVAKFSSAGWIGVDLFFALSGFLITQRLLSHNGDLWQRLRHFYRNRILRIFPLYYGFLALYALLVAPVGISYWFYFCNWTQPFDVAQIRSPLSHLWSLAVEEQFYLLWPFAVLLLPRKRLMIAGLVVLIMSPLLRYLAATRGAPADFIYRASAFRLDALVAGALVCLTGRYRLMLWSGGLLVFIVVATIGSLEWSTSTVQILGFSGTAALCAGLVGRVQDRGARFLESSAARRVGRYSYGMYLFHWPLAFVAWMPVTAWKLRLLPTLALALGESLLVFAAAALSFELFERRILILKSASARSTDAIVPSNLPQA